MLKTYNSSNLNFGLCISSRASFHLCKKCLPKKVECHFNFIEIQADLKCPNRKKCE